MPKQMDGLRRTDAPASVAGNGFSFAPEIPPHRNSHGAFWLLALFLASLLLLGLPGLSQATDTRFVYDAGGRLIQVIQPAGDSTVYAYDPAGNILSTRNITASTLAAVGFSSYGGAAGETTTIYGSGFSLTASCNIVSFNGVAATVTAATANALTVVIPAGATTGVVQVQLCTGGSAVVTSGYNITYGVYAPSVSSFSPAIGAVGASVTITGSHFIQTPIHNQVFFNRSSSPTAVASATATTLSVAVPAGATSGPLSVKTPFGSGISTQDFYVPPSPFTAASVLINSRIAFGVQQTTTFGSAGKIAMYLFDGTIGQRVALKTGATTIGSCTVGSVRILDPAGAQVGTMNLCSNQFLGPFTLAKAGTYTVVIAPYSSATGVVPLTMLDVPPDTAVPIAFGGTVTATTSSPGQGAVLIFSGTAGQRISLQSSAVASYANVVILNPDGTTLVPITMISGNTAIGPYTLPQTGTYQIKVTPYNAGGTISLTLKLWEVPPDVTGTIVIGGSAFTATTTAPGQATALTFSGTAGQRIELQTSAIGPWLNMSVLNPDGTTLVPVTMVSGSAYFGPYTLPQTGTYTLKLKPYSADGYGSGTVRIWNVPPDSSSSTTAGGTAALLSISAPGQAANLTFSGTSGQRISVKTSGPSFYYYITINNPDGTALQASSFQTESIFLGPYTLAQTGTYTIKITPSNAGTGTITVQVFDVPPDEVITATIGGPSVHPSLGTPGQSSRTELSASAGATLKVATSGSLSSYYYVTVLNPNGSTLLAKTVVTGSSQTFAVLTLAQTGTYVVLISPYNGSTGSLTLTLTSS
ncbi:MAG: RHS repeat domain-containing protein [Solimonas sp.]